MTSSTPSGSPTSCEWFPLGIPDASIHAAISMKRVEADGNWSLFCPNEAAGLHEVWGREFEELYEKYENEGRARKTIKAQELWYAILVSQIETGGPFMLYKDACNGNLSPDFDSVVY